MMKSSFSLLLVGCLIFNLGCSKKNNPLLSSPAGGVTSVSIRIPQIDTRGNDENRIFVLVQDQSGTPLQSFQLGNFSILESGIPGVPYEVGNVTDLLYVALAIDRSGSMAGANTVAANTAAVALVNAMVALDFVSLIEFGSEVKTVVGFTQDKNQVITAINDGVAEGGTALYDAISVASHELQNQAGKRLMIILTDGDDTASTIELEGAIKSANSRGVSANMVGLGTGFNEEIMEQIAAESGGTFATSTDGSTLTTIFINILNTYNSLNFIRYRRRKKGAITVFLNFGTLTAQATKSLD